MPPTSAWFHKRKAATPPSGRLKMAALGTERKSSERKAGTSFVLNRLRSPELRKSHCRVTSSQRHYSESGTLKCERGFLLKRKFWFHRSGTEA